MAKYLQTKFLEQALGPERMAALIAEYEKVKPPRKMLTNQPPTEEQYTIARDFKALGRKATAEKYALSLHKLNYIVSRVSTYTFMHS